MALCVLIFYKSREVQTTGGISSELQKRAVERREAMPSQALNYPGSAPSPAASQDPFGLGAGKPQTPAQAPSKAPAQAPPQPGTRKAAPPKEKAAQEPVDMFGEIPE